jgi:hypothetical protein
MEGANDAEADAVSLVLTDTVVLGETVDEAEGGALRECESVARVERVGERRPERDAVALVEGARVALGGPDRDALRRGDAETDTVVVVESDARTDRDGLVVADGDSDEAPDVVALADADSDGDAVVDGLAVCDPLPDTDVLTDELGESEGAPEGETVVRVERVGELKPDRDARALVDGARVALGGDDDETLPQGDAETE